MYNVLWCTTQFESSFSTMHSCVTNKITICNQIEQSEQTLLMLLIIFGLMHFWKPSMHSNKYLFCQKVRHSHAPRNLQSLFFTNAADRQANTDVL